mgnify:CR=1 FL=1
MKEYKVSVYNYIDRFHDEYRVYATNPQTAIKMAKGIMSIRGFFIYQTSI